MKKQKGFVLVELLAAVAVIIATFAVVSPNAGKIDSKLQQTTVDAYAKAIYVKAQDRITYLRTSGQQDVLKKQDELSEKPEGYVGNKNLHEISSDDPDASLFYDEDIDGKWIVEYNAETGAVFGVFASNGDLDFYKEPFSKVEEYRNSDTDDYLKFAEENDYHISYYGNPLTVKDTDTDPKQEYNQDKDPDPDPDPNPDPDPTVSTGFCYYEVYTDNTVGYYVFKPVDNKLADDKIVKGDGYGIILENASDASKINVTQNYVQNGSTKTITQNMGSCSTLTIDGGVIVKLPVDKWSWIYTKTNDQIVKSPNIAGTYNNRYYWDIAIAYNGVRDNEEWSYCPYTAKSAVDKNTSWDLPETVSIRSARQLNAMSWVYSSYFNKKWAWDWTESRLTKTTFSQDLDIDYATYDFNTYIGRAFVGQLSIGTDWGRFISDYNGNNHKISNCKFLTRYTTSNELKYAGLFGRVSLGEIYNVIIDCPTTTYTNVSAANKIEGADYCGVLASYVENAYIHDCTVSGYTIVFTQNALPSCCTTAGSNEFGNARIGGFIGYVKCPQENNSVYKTTIDNCKVKNCNITLNGSAYTSSSYYRAFQIGGFVGAIANYESNESRANHVFISDCSVEGGSMQVSTYAQGANWSYIGTFAGAIRKYVTVSNVTTSMSDAKSSNHKNPYASV